MADPAGSWMHAWDHQFSQQQIDVLRSPGVHNPDPDEMALLNEYQYNIAPTAVVDVALRGPLRRPTTDVFSGFCQNLARRTGLSQRILPAKVVDLCRVVGESSLKWSAMLKRRHDGACKAGSMTADLIDSLDRASVYRMYDAGDLSAGPDGDGATVGFAAARICVDLRIMTQTRLVRKYCAAS